MKKRQFVPELMRIKLETTFYSVANRLVHMFFFALTLLRNLACIFQAIVLRLGGYESCRPFIF